MLWAVLCILDILVRIRVQICDPYHWVTDSDPAPDPDPALFIIVFQDVNKK